MFWGETGLDEGASVYAGLRHATLPTPPTLRGDNLEDIVDCDAIFCFYSAAHDCSAAAYRSEDN